MKLATCALLAHNFEVAPRLLENLYTPGLRVTESCCCVVCGCFILQNSLLRQKLNTVWRIQKTSGLTLFPGAVKPGRMRQGFVLYTRIVCAFRKGHIPSHLTPWDTTRHSFLNTGLSKKMDGIWNRYNLKSTGRIYTFGVLKCSEKFKVLDLP